MIALAALALGWEAWTCRVETPGAPMTSLTLHWRAEDARTPGPSVTLLHDLLPNVALAGDGATRAGRYAAPGRVAVLTAAAEGLHLGLDATPPGGGRLQLDATCRPAP